VEGGAENMLSQAQGVARSYRAEGAAWSGALAPETLRQA